MRNYQFVTYTKVNYSPLFSIYANLYIMQLFPVISGNFLLVLGRIHAAVVSSINLNSRSVTVEWSEKGETKGKEVTLVTWYSISIS